MRRSSAVVHLAGLLLLVIAPVRSALSSDLQPRVKIVVAPTGELENALEYEYESRASDPGRGDLGVEPVAATIRDRVLRLGNEEVCAAEEVLAQTVVGPQRFVVVRHVFNSLRNPLHLLSALTGHPVQVSRILLVVSGGEVETKVLEITRRKNTSRWTAEIVVGGQGQ